MKKSIALFLALLMLAALSACGGSSAPGQTVPEKGADSAQLPETAAPAAVPTVAPSAEAAELPASSPMEISAVDPYLALEAMPEAAKAYADLLRSSAHPVVKAALFDGGGVPMIWVAYGDSLDYSHFALEGGYGSSIYTYRDGGVEKCTEISTLLREGEHGVAAFLSGENVGDFDLTFKLYYISQGRIDAQPFAVGQQGINGAFLNGVQYGEYEQYPTLRSIFLEAEPNLDELLYAYDGLAGILFLKGSRQWLDRTEMLSVLDSCAGTEAEPLNLPAVPFLVVTPDWNTPVYQGPSTLSPVEMYIDDPGTYTIVETEGNMGRLKSGAGWLDLSAVTLKY